MRKTNEEKRRVKITGGVALGGDYREGRGTINLATCSWPERWPVLAAGENILLVFLGHAVKSGETPHRPDSG